MEKGNKCQLKLQWATYTAWGCIKRECELFLSYIEKMEIFIMPNNIPELGNSAVNAQALKVTVREYQKGILLLKLAQKSITHSWLEALQIATYISFVQVLRRLEVYFIPLPLGIMESYKFSTHNQELGEAVSDYIAALK